MAYNKQPIFTNVPILRSTIIDPPIITSNYDPAAGSPTSIYSVSSTEGDLIDRITISATGDLTNNDVSAKLIYVYIRWDNGGSPVYSLYKTLAMPAATISHTTPNPEIELTFSGGLVLNTNDRIYVGASVNYSTNNYYGDYLSITIEGGSYTATA